MMSIVENGWGLPVPCFATGHSFPDSGALFIDRPDEKCKKCGITRFDYQWELFMKAKYG